METSGERQLYENKRVQKPLPRVASFGAYQEGRARGGDSKIKSHPNSPPLKEADAEEEEEEEEDKEEKNTANMTRTIESRRHAWKKSMTKSSVEMKAYMFQQLEEKAAKPGEEKSIGIDVLAAECRGGGEGG